MPIKFELFGSNLDQLQMFYLAKHYLLLPKQFFHLHLEHLTFLPLLIRQLGLYAQAFNLGHF
jgi:hypothetical protein